MNLFRTTPPPLDIDGLFSYSLSLPLPPPLSDNSVDPFKSKQKYEVRAPSYFANRSAGMTICSKTTGNSECVVLWLCLGLSVCCALGGKGGEGGIFNSYHQAKKFILC